MCGIAGVFDMEGLRVPDRGDLEGMAAAQGHRGPDGFGFMRGPGIGFAHARLSIIDLDGGWQPLSSEDGNVWVVFNGEIFNYREIRKNLLSLGHRFATDTDAEVLVHLYEEKGIPGLLDELNGQYAFALFGRREQALYLVRDHVGILPLNYRLENGWLEFASEVKGLLSRDGARAELDPRSLDELFTFWGPVSGNTLFKGVREVPPGHFLKAAGGNLGVVRYWDVPFGKESPDDGRSLQDYAGELRGLLEEATRLRLIADVPVGAYLSGGLDSSAVTRLTRGHTGDNLRTFSVAFEDPDFDESSYQKLLNDVLKTENSSVQVGGDSIANAFEKVILHAEKPVLRTAPAPMLLLSGSVRGAGFRTVVTGEGADEFLGGYDIYKEAMLRAFWSRNPDSAFRGSLFKKLYPYLKTFSSRPTDYLREYFRLPVPGWDELFASHWVRWTVTSRIRNFYQESFRESLGGYDPVLEYQDRTRDRLRGLGTLERAQYIEIDTLLPNYLLSSQGDRMAMANSVEVRFPFLDRKVIEFSGRIPAHCKMLGLKEKAVLKRSMAGELPEPIVRRFKRPYMAPDIPSFFTPGGELKAAVRPYLSPGRIAAAGVFNGSMVDSLVRKCARGKAVGFGDSMAFVGILSTQMWMDLFAGRRPGPAPFDTGKIRKDHLLDGGSDGKHCR